MAFTFFFEQYDTPEEYFKTIEGISISDRNNIDTEPPEGYFSIENLYEYPKRLKLVTADENETLDIRLFHDYISAVQLLYSIFQSNGRYERYEQILSDQYFTALSKKETPFVDPVNVELDLFFRELNMDYELITELAEKRNFLKINTAVKIESISKNSPLEIVFASSFFLLTLSVILSGGKLKVDVSTKTIEVEIPNLASGLRPLLKIFRKEDRDSKSEDQDLLGSGGLFDEDEEK